MDEAALIGLVRQAIGLHKTTNCLEFEDEDLQRRIRRDRQLQLLGTPREIRAILVRYVDGGGTIDYRLEIRDEYKLRRECWFRVRVPILGCADRLFFELELIDDDPDYPSVAILNVHFIRLFANEGFSTSGRITLE